MRNQDHYVIFLVTIIAFMSNYAKNKLLVQLITIIIENSLQLKLLLLEICTVHHMLLMRSNVLNFRCLILYVELKIFVNKSNQLLPYIIIRNIYNFG